MPNDPKENEIPLGILVRSLGEGTPKAALDDLLKICKAKSPSEKRDIGIMLRAALGNGRHYLSELVEQPQRVIPPSMGFGPSLPQRRPACYARACFARHRSPI
jgi:hypothetical protein